MNRKTAHTLACLFTGLFIGILATAGHFNGRFNDKTVLILDFAWYAASCIGVGFWMLYWWGWPADDGQSPTQAHAPDESPSPPDESPETPVQSGQIARLPGGNAHFDHRAETRPAHADPRVTAKTASDRRRYWRDRAESLDPDMLAAADVPGGRELLARVLDAQRTPDDMRALVLDQLRESARYTPTLLTGQGAAQADPASARALSVLADMRHDGYERLRRMGNVAVQLAEENEELRQRVVSLLAKLHDGASVQLADLPEDDDDESDFMALRSHLIRNGWLRHDGDGRLFWTGG